MLFFNSLTKKQRRLYLSDFLKSDIAKVAHRKYGSVHDLELARIQYLFESNSRCDIENWFKFTSATVSFPGAHLISVFMHNRISEILHGY